MIFALLLFIHLFALHLASVYNSIRMLLHRQQACFQTGIKYISNQFSCPDKSQLVLDFNIPHLNEPWEPISKPVRIFS